VLTSVAGSEEQIRAGTKEQIRASCEAQLELFILACWHASFSLICCAGSVSALTLGSGNLTEFIGMLFVTVRALPDGTKPLCLSEKCLTAQSPASGATKAVLSPPASEQRSS
jgi:hypothetical protein